MKTATRATLALPKRRMTLFERSLAASFGMHILLFGWLNRTPTLDPSANVEPDIIDVDIRTPFRPRDPRDKRLPGAMKAAPAPMTFKPALVAVPLPPAQTQPSQTPEQAVGDASDSANKPKDWVLPGPQTKTLDKPTLDSAPAAAAPALTAPGATGPGGMGGQGSGTHGSGTGGDLVDRPPRLINREEVLASLRRFYPELERRAGREGRVVVELVIGIDWLVHGIDIVNSAGELFDQAARSVGKLMRFEPELKASVPVQSRKKLPVHFQLTN